MRQAKLLLLLAAISFNCFAQKRTPILTMQNDSILHELSLLKEPRLLLNIHGGYAMGLGSTFKFYPDDVSAISVIKAGNGIPQKSISYSNPSKGLGDGFRIGAGLSYILNDFINIGIDLDYFKSTIYKTRDSSYRFTNPTPAMGEPDESSYTSRKTISYNATLISLTPNITFKAIAKPKWFIYKKLGLVLTFRPNSLQEDINDINFRQAWQGFIKDSASREVNKYEWGIKNPALGFMGSIGMQIKVAPRIRAFGELQFSHIVFIVKKRSLTEFSVNGTDLKNTLPVSDRELEFVKSYTTNFLNRNPDQPSLALVQRIPITYVGAQMGLAFQLK